MGYREIKHFKPLGCMSSATDLYLMSPASSGTVAPRRRRMLSATSAHSFGPSTLRNTCGGWRTRAIYLAPLDHGAGSSCRSLYALALMFPPKLSSHTHTPRGRRCARPPPARSRSGSSSPCVGPARRHGGSRRKCEAPLGSPAKRTFCDCGRSQVEWSGTKLVPGSCTRC